MTPSPDDAEVKVLQDLTGRLVQQHAALGMMIMDFSERVPKEILARVSAAHDDLTAAIRLVTDEVNR